MNTLFSLFVFCCLISSTSHSKVVGEIRSVSPSSKEMVLVHGFAVVTSPEGVFANADAIIEEFGFKIISNPKEKTHKSLIKLAQRWKLLLKEPLRKCHQHGNKYHFIGHSLGGVILRVLLRDPEVNICMESLTTISSPHRGSDVSDLVGSLIPHDTLRSLRSEEMKKYNEKFLLSELEISKKLDISLWSIISRPDLSDEVRSGFVYYSLTFLRWIKRKVFGFAAGDGIVPLTSQKYGEVLKELPYNHGEIINFRGSSPVALREVFKIITDAIKKRDKNRI